MASFKLALFLFISLQGYALTSTLSADGLQTVPDDLSVNGDVCQDCIKIFELLTDLLSNADLQKKIMNGIEGLCDHLPLPASTAKLCKDEVEKILPLAINFITGIAKPAEICKIIGLCSSSCATQEKMLSYFVKEALHATMANENEPSTSSCSFCIFLIKTLEGMLPKERTEAAVINLLDEICHIVPAAFRNQCQDVIAKFGKTVLDAILGYATPEAICSLIHMCHGHETAVADPCILTTYRCRDIRTALRCGTMYYCQKFVWKPFDYKTL